MLIVYCIIFGIPYCYGEKDLGSYDFVFVLQIMMHEAYNAPSSPIVSKGGTSAHGKIFQLKTFGKDKISPNIKSL